MRYSRPLGSGHPSDRSTAAVVHYFNADPLRAPRAELIARDLGLPLTAVQPILDRLVALGILDRKTPESGEPAVYLSRVADQLLDVIERLFSYFTEQMEDVAVSPERAQLVTGEQPPEVGGIRSLRVRVASLEAANALLRAQKTSNSPSSLRRVSCWRAL